MNDAKASHGVTLVGGRCLGLLEVARAARRAPPARSRSSLLA